MEILNGIFVIVGVVVGWLISVYQFKSERKDKFRLASIEKRLEAHQLAYSYCMKAFDTMFSDDNEVIRKIIKEGQTFMSNFSLYLEKGTRRKMVDVIGFFNAYCPKIKFLEGYEISERNKALKTFHAKSKVIFELAKIVQEEVELEPISVKQNYEIKD